MSKKKSSISRKSKNAYAFFFSSRSDDLSELEERYRVLLTLRILTNPSEK